MWLSLLVSHGGAGHGVNQPLSQQAAKSAAAEAEVELIKVRLQILLRQTMIGAQDKCFRVADHDV